MAILDELANPIIFSKLYLHKRNEARSILKDILENHIEIAFEITSQIKPFEFFEEYLKNGAYPYYFENKQNYSIKLEETINATIEFDLGLIFDIKPINSIKLKKLIYLICNSEPFELNITKLSQK